MKRAYYKAREKRLARQQVKWMSLALMVKIYSKYIIEPEVFNYKITKKEIKL